MDSSNWGIVRTRRSTRSSEEEAAAVRALFPEVGDLVRVWHASQWRQGQVTFIHPSAAYSYDITLSSDGSWTPEELVRFRKLFRKYDVDGGGQVDVEELRNLLIELEHPAAFDDDAVADIVRRVDKDQSGSINFEEFCDLIFVELKESIGVETHLFRVPSVRLRNDAKKIRQKPFAVVTGDPHFGPLIENKLRAHEHRRRRERAERLHRRAMSRRAPLMKFSDFQPRPMLANRSDARAATKR